jgi:hypothetical protein
MQALQAATTTNTPAGKLGVAAEAVFSYSQERHHWPLSQIMDTTTPPIPTFLTRRDGRAVKTRGRDVRNGAPHGLP